MRVINKTLPTSYGIDANYWLTTNIKFNLDRDSAELTFNGYPTSDAILNENIELTKRTVTVNGILDMPNSMNDNVYESVFGALVSKILATDIFSGGTIVEI